MAYVRPVTRSLGLIYQVLDLGSFSGLACQLQGPQHPKHQISPQCAETSV